MKVLGLESVARDIAEDGFFVKCIVNCSLAVFFPGTVQHRDVKISGVSYEDDYGGNALAVTITPGRIEVRYHQRYTDEAVEKVFEDLLELPEMNWASAFRVRYQGRVLFGGDRS